MNTPRRPARWFDIITYARAGDYLAARSLIVCWQVPEWAQAELLTSDQREAIAALPWPAAPTYTPATTKTTRRRR
jgi:hypothetical protein